MFRSLVGTSANISTPRRIWLGRDREIGVLEAAVDDLLSSGRGSVFLLTGEPGIGKTRLADELSDVAKRRGLAVHWGRAWEVGGAPSYWPFIQVLRSIFARATSENETTRLIGPHKTELAELMPELLRTDSSVVRRVSDRFQLFDAVNSVLHQAATSAPLVIVLDDLHAADASSILLLHFIVRDFRSRPLLLIGTYREAEARLSTEIGSLLTRVARDASVLPLRRWERAEIASFVTQSTGSEVASDRLDVLEEQTEGNPLFLRELLQLQSSAAHARKPEGIREVVRARLDLLTPAVRALLETASILGREFELSLLSALLSNANDDVPIDLNPAVDAGIVEPISETRWRFTHVLLREGLYETLTADRRAELHRSAAHALRDSKRNLPLAEIAHHLLKATPLVDAEEASAAALSAADRAMTLFAFEDASDLFGRAARLLESMDGEGEKGDETEASALTERSRLLFEALLGLGISRIRGADVDAGKIMCHRAADLARRLGDGELLARAVLGSAYEYTPGVRNRELISFLEEALNALPPGDGALRARCMAQLAAERQPEPDPTKPAELALTAVLMARRLGEEDRETTLRFTLTAAGLAIMVFVEPEVRMPLNQETLRLALAHGDKRVALRAHLLLSNDCWEQGDVGGASAHVQSYESIAREFRHGSFDWVGVCLRYTHAIWHGHFDEAARLYRESLELMEKDETRGTSMAAQPVAYCCAFERYEGLEIVEARVRDAFGCSMGSHELGSCIGEMFITQLHGRAANDRVRAAAQLAAVRSHPVFEQIKEPAWLALLTDACHLVGDKALAEKLYAALLPRAHRFYTVGHLGPSCEPTYSRQLGLLAETLGRTADAVKHLEAAEESATRAGMRGALARLHYELARALRLTAEPGDVAKRARTLLENAKKLAEELGQTGLLPRIRLALEDAQGASPTTSTADDDDAFSITREGDYWTVVSSSSGGRTLRLKDSRGMQVLDRLVSNPGQEFHVLQLAGSSTDEDDAKAHVVDRRASDAGPVLDEVAIQNYRQRLLDLREEQGEAERFSDEGRKSRAEKEIEFLTTELARAVGLGGRERRVGAAAERARTAVQKRLRTAIQKIHDEVPELGRHLDQTIRTGTFCGYLPGGRPRSRRG